MVVLPYFVTFKGDNNLYLDSVWTEGYPYHQFSSNDPRVQGAVQEVFITDNGFVLIKSTYYGKFWRRSPNWIWADTDFNFEIDHTSPIDSSKINKDCLFEPIMVGDNMIALRNLGNNYFCKRLTTEGKESCLNAGVATITREATLEVSEAIVDRQISNVNYYLDDARIYNQTPIVIGVTYAENDTASPASQTLNFSVVDTTTNTWTSSVSLKLGVKAKFKAGIPIIGETEIEVSTEFTGTYSWGETRTTARTLASTITVTVPPKSRMKVSMLATQGSCDVPFSYTQRDTLVNGNSVTYEKKDGLFTGVNAYKVNFKTEDRDLSCFSETETRDF